MSDLTITIIGGGIVALLGVLATTVIGSIIHSMRKDNDRRDNRLNSHAEELDSIRRDYVRRDDNQRDRERIEGKLDKILDLLIRAGIGRASDREEG